MILVMMVGGGKILQTFMMTVREDINAVSSSSTDLGVKS